MPADHSIDNPRVIRRDAASAPITKPEGARSSVFDNKRPKRAYSSPFDPDQVPIEADVPIPKIVRHPGGGYAGLYARMQPGERVKLSERQAQAFRAWGRKAGVALVLRKLGPDQFGVWKPTPEQMKEDPQ